VLLSADRIEVGAGDRIRTVLIVSTPVVSVRASGDLDRLRHDLEDVGFSDVQVSADRPVSWRFGADVPHPDGLEWLLFAELTARRSASLQRQLTSELRLATAWEARLDGEPAIPFHPYAAHFCATARAAGPVRAYANAYPMEVF
jgi:hypothetical protein